MPPSPGEVELSVVAPAHNEQENIPALVEEVERGVRPLGLEFEFIVVDDGSTDGTREALKGLMRDRPWLRCVAMMRTPPGRAGGWWRCWTPTCRTIRRIW
jgi:dolichol-phosphate mannosyltransferase